MKKKGKILKEDGGELIANLREHFNGKSKDILYNNFDKDEIEAYKKKYVDSDKISISYLVNNLEKINTLNEEEKIIELGLKLKDLISFNSNDRIELLKEFGFKENYLKRLVSPLKVLDVIKDVNENSQFYYPVDFIMNTYNYYATQFFIIEVHNHLTRGKNFIKVEKTILKESKRREMDNVKRTTHSNHQIDEFIIKNQIEFNKQTQSNPTCFNLFNKNLLETTQKGLTLPHKLVLTPAFWEIKIINEILLKKNFNNRDYLVESYNLYKALLINPSRYDLKDDDEVYIDYRIDLHNNIDRYKYKIMYAAMS